MTQALIVSNVLLWIVVLGLAFLVWALMRQIGVLHERIAPAGALTGSEGPRVGEESPILELEDWNGRVVRVGGEQEQGMRTLIFFLSPSCPVCKTLLPTVRSVRAAEGPALRVVLASDGPHEEHIAFVRAERLDRETYVVSTQLGMTFQVAKLPYAVLLDEKGVVRARGLVNTREHLESLFEASEQGVASLQEFVAGRKEGERVA